MPFFRPLSKTAPGYNRNLPWPLHGLAYVASFMGPISAGPFAGLIAGDWIAAVIGLVLGIAITLLNGSLTDRFLEPLIARYQKLLCRGLAHIIVNVFAFAWAFALSGLAMYGPILIFGNRLLLRVR